MNCKINCFSYFLNLWEKTMKQKKDNEIQMAEIVISDTSSNHFIST